MNAFLLKSKARLPAIVATGIVLLGIILTAARIHGFSFPRWHKIIDNSPPHEVLFNNAKPYRTDDFLVMLPHMLAQRADQPPFAHENRLIGDGHYNMLIADAAPVLSVTTLLRPQAWGYFVSGDVGMAFQWWFYTLGVWFSTWLLLRRVTKNDELTSACGATALLFSPFFQTWSLNCAPTVIFGCGTILALDRLSRDQSGFQIGLSSTLLTWFMGALLLTFNYTPYLIGMLYFIVFVSAGLAAARRNRNTADCQHVAGALPGSLPRRLGMRWMGALAAVLFIAGLGVYLAAKNWDVVTVISGSAYPGQRLSSGGDQPVLWLFRGNIFNIQPLAWCDCNPCEATAFFLVFPLVLAALLRDWWRTRQPPPTLSFFIAAYIVLLLTWNLVGLPEPIARWTLLNRVPPSRTLLLLGIADLFLVSIYVSSRNPARAVLRRDRWSPWIASLLWIAFHVWLGWRMAYYFPAYSFSKALIGGYCAMALAPILYLAPRVVLPLLMFVCLLISHNINPLCRGGTAFIQANPLSQEIKTLNCSAAQNGRQPVWIAYGDEKLPNLFRMIGAHALNGVHAYSQLQLWNQLDPEGRFRPIYNRYAHVVFEAPDVPDDFQIKLLYTDRISVRLHPENQRFAALQADFLLCLDKEAILFDNIAKLKKIYSYAGKHIYKVMSDVPAQPRD